MKTQHSRPSRAACADTLLARLPVDAQRDHLEAELDGARGGDRDDAVLVRQRRMIDRVVFEVQLAEPEPLREPVAADERRESRIEAR